MPAVFSKSPKDFYHVLKLPRNATLEQIKKSYKRLVLQTHPDKSRADDATAEFQLVSRSNAASTFILTAEAARGF